MSAIMAGLFVDLARGAGGPDFAESLCMDSMEELEMRFGPKTLLELDKFEAAKDMVGGSDSGARAFLRSRSLG